MGNNRRGTSLLIRKTQLIRKGSLGLPARRGAGGGLLHHLVDLLQGETLGLRDEEVGVDKGAGAEGTPDEEDLGLEVALVGVDHVGGDDGDDAVPEPVGGGGEGDTAGTDGEGEDFCEYVSFNRVWFVSVWNLPPMTTQAPGPQVLAKKKM